jgi:hypothetical protein
MKKFLAPAAALLLAVAACGDAAPATTAGRSEIAPLTTTVAPEALATTTTAAAAIAPAGFYEYDGDGFRILMPDDWTIAARGDIELQAILEELTASGLDDLVPAIQGAFAQGGKLFAFDFASSTFEFTNNINILRLDPPGLSGANLVGVAEKDIRRLGATDIAGRVEWVPAGEAVIVSYSLPDDLGGGEGLSYTVLTNDSQWVITYTAIDVAPFAESFRLMMDYFREG